MDPPPPCFRSNFPYALPTHKYLIFHPLPTIVQYFEIPIPPCVTGVGAGGGSNYVYIYLNKAKTFLGTFTENGFKFLISL